ncbi:MAG: hypothetical protein ABL889_01890 [Terricaulis sp.]
MISMEFSGWAQCRLATDPDPYDEPRGVSGYMRAYVGEPDLDRVIHLQPIAFKRSYGHPGGVTVTHVRVDEKAQDNHPLIGAAVELLGEAKFEGRNGAIEEDTLEPIVPFHLKITKGDASFSRATVASDPSSPYREFKAIDFSGELSAIQDATGIKDIADVWRMRLQKLQEELNIVSADPRPGLEERIADLIRNIERAPSGVAVYFPARMFWSYALKSRAVATPKAFTTLMPGFSPHKLLPWTIDFWFGGWDADAQQFFVKGELSIPDDAMTEAKALRLPSLNKTLIRRPERLKDA